MVMIDFKSSISMLAVIAAVAILPTAALAQKADAAGDNARAAGEIVVTAQRRLEAARDVPITITSISQEQLATANVNSLADTSKLTAGLRFDSQGPAVQPTIRGVGTAITTSGGGPNVGVYVDGFFQPNTFTTDFQMARVKDVQVLKGPQGTLFGRSTTGGAILLTTADPSSKTAVEMRASYGRLNALTLQGYATTGTDNVAFDIEGLYRSGDGYFTDVIANNNKIGKYRNWLIRTGLKLNVSDSVSLLLRYVHSETNDPTTQLVNAFVDTTGEAGFFSQVSAAGKAEYGKSNSVGLPLVQMLGVTGSYAAPAGAYATKPGEIALNAPVGFTTKSDTFQGTLKADLGFANFTSYTQYRKDHTPFYGDLDAIAIPLFNLLLDIRDQSFSQEFLLSSKPGSPLQWTAGLNYFQSRDTWDFSAAFGGPFFAFGGSSANTKSYAGFLDATYEVSDKLFVTLGGRYSHDIVTDAYFVTNPTTTSYTGPSGETIPFVGLPGTHIGAPDLTNNSFTPRAVLRYKPSDNSSIYASYAKGYKAGLLDLSISVRAVKPESINAFELGYKYDDRLLSASFAGFYYDYKNLQVSSFQSGTAQVRNAASSEIYGLEGQLRYKFSSNFTIYSGAAWTHARYKSFPNAPYYSYCDPISPSNANMVCGPYGKGSLTQTSINASGYKMQRSPELTANLGASYGMDVAGGKLTFSGNLYYTSSFYFDPTQQFRQDSYALLSARAQWTDASDHFTLAVFGDNLTNKRFKTQVLFNTLGIGSVWSSPTTYGVSLGVKY